MRQTPQHVPVRRQRGGQSAVDRNDEIMGHGGGPEVTISGIEMERLLARLAGHARRRGAGLRKLGHAWQRTLPPWKHVLVAICYVMFWQEPGGQRPHSPK